MKKTKFTEEQIAFALRQAETGTRVAEVCRKLGISDATFYNWRKKYGGLGVPELRRFHQILFSDMSIHQVIFQYNLSNVSEIPQMQVFVRFIAVTGVPNDPIFFLMFISCGFCKTGAGHEYRSEPPRQSRRSGTDMPTYPPAYLETRLHGVKFVSHLSLG